LARAVETDRVRHGGHHLKSMVSIDLA
jgi:hypothetical protein